jgi:hypothetical protein
MTGNIFQNSKLIKRQVETSYIGICQADGNVKNAHNLFLIAPRSPAPIQEKCCIFSTTHVAPDMRNLCACPTERDGVFKTQEATRCRSATCRLN